MYEHVLVNVIALINIIIIIIIIIIENNAATGHNVPRQYNISDCTTKHVGTSFRGP